MDFKQKISEITSDLLSDKKKLIRVLATVIIVAVIPLTVIVARITQEIRQRASGEDVRIYFAMGGSSDPINEVSLIPGQQASLALYLDTGSTPVNGFDINVSLANALGKVTITDPVEGADATQFDTLLVKRLRGDIGMVYFAKVLTDTSKTIQGRVHLATVAFTVNADASGNGSIGVTKAEIISPTKDSLLTVAMPAINYSINMPTQPPVPPVATSTTAPIAPGALSVAVTNNVSCASASTYSGNEASVNWTNASLNRVEIAGAPFSTILSSSYPTNYYQKNVTGTSTPAPEGFTKADGSGRVLSLTAGQTVYARGCVGNQCGPETTFSIPACSTSGTNPTPATSTLVPPAATNNVSCVYTDKYSGSEVTISGWSSGVTRVEIAGAPFSTILSSSYPTNYYQKNVTGTSTPAPEGFTKADGSGRILSLSARQTVYLRACTADRCSDESTFSVPACPAQ